MSPREGYDRVAAFYDQWPWQRFWEANELPVVMEMVSSTGAQNAVDVGVGTGRYLEALRKQNIEGVGVDISPDMLQVASQRSHCAGHLLEADARALPFEASKLELVVAARVLSHVPEIEQAVSEIERVLRPGGHAILTDVDGEHAYEHTRVETPYGDVQISVVKRTLSEMLHHIGMSGRLGAVRVCRLRADNVPYLPSEYELRTIDRSGQRAVGYILLCRRKS